MIAEPMPQETLTHSCLAFVLDQEEYAIDLRRIREIVRYQGLTRVPGAPPAVLGVANIRGGIVPVIDVAMVLGLPATMTTPWTCLVVVEPAIDGKTTPVSFLAASVERVLEIRDNEIEPTPSFGMRAPERALLGVVKVDSTFVRLLDIDMVFGEGLVKGVDRRGEPRR